MFFLDSFSSVCGGDGDVATTPTAAAVPENEAYSTSLQEHGKNNDAGEPVDAKNVFVTNLTRPMGILFEENAHGGTFAAEINEGYSAAADGSICRGDHVIAIGDTRVNGMAFDAVMKLIEVEDSEIEIKLTLFRGSADTLYGPFGARNEWLDELVAERGEEAVLVEEEEEDSQIEGEVMSDIADVGVSHELLDAAVAITAAVDADALREAKADQILVDVEAHAEEEDDVAEEVLVVVVENVVEADEQVECEGEQENKVDAAEEEMLAMENDAECSAGVENQADAILVVEDEAEADEQVEGEAELENEMDAAEEVLVVENESVSSVRASVIEKENNLTPNAMSIWAVEDSRQSLPLWEEVKKLEFGEA